MPATGINWPWIAAIVAVVIGLFKGVAAIWSMARSVERIESMTTQQGADIAELKEARQQDVTHNAHWAGKFEARLEDFHRRIAQVEN